MTAVTSLSPVLTNTAQPILAAVPTTSQTTTTTTGATSTQVSLNQIASPLTYSPAQLLTTQTGSGQVWSNTTSDPINVVLAKNINSADLSGRFAGLGSALLTRLNTNATNFNQSVVTYVPDNSNSTQPTDWYKQAQGKLQYQPTDQITLNITTQSGNQINIILRSTAAGLGVEESSSSQLTSSDASAISQLATGFQTAIDGLSASNPTINLSGLLQVDPSAFKSLDLNAQLVTAGNSPFSLTLHLDDTQRQVAINTSAGTAKVNVNLQHPTLWGNQAQQNKALNLYAQQFSQAASRGRADSQLMSLFTAAFTQANLTAPTTPSALHYGNTLTDIDQSMLTGLADFSASVVQNATSPNPLHLDETDHFTYQISQQTQIQGSKKRDWSMSQQQQATLSASYHRALFGGTPPQLTTEPSSQNYYYDQIDDSARATISLSYANNVPVQASLSKNAHQQLHETKHEMDNVTTDTTTPLEATIKQDLLPTLLALQENPPKQQKDVMARTQTLQNINNQIFLQQDPNQIQPPTSHA